LEDIAFRVIAANQVPDHATIARFRQRHEVALAGLFAQVLELCAKAGLVHLDLIAVDGTKIAANASRFANRTYEQLAREIIGEAVRIDAAEDAEHGRARGDEMPAQFGNQQGRRGWIREARKELECLRDEQPDPVPGPRAARLAQARRRLLEDHQIEVDANAAYERYRSGGKDKTGRGFGRSPNPMSMPELPAGTVNTSDPDSHKMRTPHGPAQAYNAQAVCTREHIIIAAEITTAGVDFGQLGPMIETARHELRGAGVERETETVLADSGYWNQDAMDHLAADGITVLIPPDAKTRSGTRPGWDGGRYAFMRAVLDEPEGRWRYARRQGMIEPVFADLKFNRRIDRFLRRGRGACSSEWKLAAATHNLLKLYRATRPALA